MIFKLIRYLKGYVKVILRGDSVERFINICRAQNIQLWGLVSGNHCCEICMSINDFRRLIQIRRKTGIHIDILHKYGFPFLIHSFSKRKLFFVGFFLFCSIIFYCCNTIWSVHFSGNQFYTQETLNRYLCHNNIRIGMNKNKVKCEEIVQLLRTQYHEIVWVSASIDGTCLKIQIKENTQSDPENVNNESSPNNPTDIIASKSGKIYQLVTREGLPVIHEGDNVSAGDILVTGIIPIKNDANEIIANRSVTSDADILAETSYYYEDIVNHNYLDKQYSKKHKYTFYMHFNHSGFTLFPQSLNKNEEAHVSNYTSYLLQKFGITVSCGMKQTIPYMQKTKKMSKKHSHQILSKHFKAFCSNLEKKGVQIISNSVKIKTGVSESKAEGVIYTIEKVGIPRITKIPEIENERINTE